MIIRFSPPSASTTRILSATDAEHCAEIHARSFHVGWSAAEFENLLIKPNVIGDGCCRSSDDKMLGFVLSRIAVDEAELLTIACERKQQGNGMGTLLLGEHLTNLQKKAAKNVYLEVAEDNVPAIRLYTKFGFAKVGQRLGYYQTGLGNTANAQVMKLEL